MNHQFIALSLLLAPSSVFAAGTGHHHHHDDLQNTAIKSSAPASIMGDHTHKAGEFMVSYRRMNMVMDGNRQGTDRISSDEIVAESSSPKLLVTPVTMTITMDMLGVMYGFTDQVNGFLMLNYLTKDMDHQTYSGADAANGETTVLERFNVTNEGFGDVMIGALYEPKSTTNLSTIYKLGLSIPTGSIEEEAEVLAPNGNRPVLRSPYAMQLGSGTYDLLPAITLKYSSGNVIVGGQYSGTIRTGINDEDYRLGNRHELTSWVAGALNDKVSLNSRLALQQVDAIKGRDSNIGAPIQTADPDNYERFDALVGVGAEYRFAPTAYEHGVKVLGEYLFPIYQDVEGVQMNRKGMLTLAVKISF